jgi:hypothetical protein
MNDLTAWPYVLGMVVTLVLGGFAVLTVDNPNRDKVAQGFFTLAAMIWAGRMFMWGISTSHTFALRLVVCFLCFGAVGVGLVEGFRFASHGKEPAPKRPTSTQALAEQSPRPLVTPSPMPSLARSTSATKPRKSAAPPDDGEDILLGRKKRP